MRTGIEASVAERWTGWITLTDAALGIGFSLWMAASLPLLPLFGAAAALAVLLSARTRVAGLAACLLFHGMHIVSYYSGTTAIAFKAGFSIGHAVHLPRATVIVNLAALAFSILIAWLLLRRRLPVRASADYSAD